MRFLALDFEGSGTDPQENAPVTLGAAVFDGETVAAQKEWLIAPPTHYADPSKVTRCYDERARMIHGYSLERLMDEGEPIKSVCLSFAYFVQEHGMENRPIVAYNAAYDMPMMSTLMFLGGEYDRYERKYRPFPIPVSGPWQCVYQLAQRRLGTDVDDFKLDTVAARFDLARSGMHGALEDAILAGRVFLAIRAMGAKEEAA